MNLRSSTSTLILLFSFTTFLHAQFAPCESQWIESVSIQDVSCSGETDGSIAVLVDSSFFGNLSFVWSDNNIGDVSTASNLDAGNYGLTLSFGPNEGCVVSDSLFVSEPKPLNLECYEVPFIPFLPTNNRLIGVDIDGGTPPYLVVWSGPVNGQKDEPEMGETIISGLVSGDYSITVTDANGCAETCDTTLPCPVSINLKELNSPSCAEGNDGSISVALAGDWASVLWSTGDSTQTAGSLTAGTYSVTVTGSDGCTKSLENIELDEPNTLEVQIDTLIGDKSRITNTGEAHLTITGGTYPYTLTWQGQSTTNGTQTGVTGSVNINPLAYGAYNLTVTDSENCELVTDFFIYDVFVVEPGDAFILDFTDNSTQAFIDSIENTITADALGTKERWCDCVEGRQRLQLWHADQQIEIYSNGSGSGSKTKGDTSGLGKILVWPDPPEEGDSNENCTYPPAKPNDDAKVIQVALIDSGSNLESDFNPQGHPSLPNLVWTNKGEPLPFDGLDSDANCIVDDREGNDFLNDLNIVIDSVGHGTHIAGIIADGYPESINLEIINLKVFTRDPTGKDRGGLFDLVCAIHHAINNGADVINLSLGYKNAQYSDPLYRALKRAEKAGIVVIASAGNSGHDLDSPNFPIDSTQWPVRFTKPIQLADSTLSRLTNMLVVAGVDSANVEAPNADLDLKQSNYGAESVDLAARSVFKGPNYEGGEITFRGTSMAAGGLTRLVSILKALKPGLTPQTIIDTITSTVQPVASAHLLKSGGRLRAAEVLKQFNITEPTYKQAVDPPLDQQIGWPPNFMLKLGEGFEIELNFTDPSLYYENVRFRVYDGNTPNIDFFSKEYCNTNIIPWDGIGNDGTAIPNPGNHFMEFFVGDKKFGPQKITVVE